MRQAAGARRGGPAASRTPPKYTAAGRLPVPPAATIRINPAVLRWVMDNEGWDADELARETGLGASQIRRWASVESDIRIRDLRRMSAKFKRPMSVLYMAEAPKVAVPPYCSRDGSGRGAARPSRGMLDVVRKARYLQSSAAEMLLDMGRDARPDVHAAAIGQSPASAAALNAGALGIGLPQGSGGGEARDRLRYRDVRERIESRNVFAMQDAIPAEDGASGLALARPEPAVVLANSRDTPRQRTFALLHGYAHVVLGRDAICAAGRARPGAGEALQVERWCDKFAATALMPEDAFRDALESAGGAGCGEPLAVADALADRFCVSRAASLMRAAEVLGGGGAGAAYSRCHTQARRGTAPVEGGAKSRSTPGGPSQATLCLARKGRKYARLVFDAMESDAITTSTALGHLGIKLEDMDEVMAKCDKG